MTTRPRSRLGVAHLSAVLLVALLVPQRSNAQSDTTADNAPDSLPHSTKDTAVSAAASLTKDAPCTRDACESWLPRYVAALQTQDDSTRAQAIRLLARLGTPESAAALRPTARRPGPHQATALAGLGWAASKRDLDAHLAALRSPDPSVRHAGLWVCGAFLDDNAVRPLQMVLQAAEPAAVAAAVDAIGLSRLSSLFSTVAQAGLSESDAVRAASLRALAAMPLPGAALLYQDRLRAEAKEHVRRRSSAPLGAPQPSSAERAPADSIDKHATTNLSELFAIAHDADIPLSWRAAALAAASTRLGPSDAWLALEPSAPAPLRSLEILAQHAARADQGPAAVQAAWRHVFVAQHADSALALAGDAPWRVAFWTLGPSPYRRADAVASPGN